MSGRGGAGKAGMPHFSDFIALGSKSSSAAPGQAAGMTSGSKKPHNLAAQAQTAAPFRGPSWEHCAIDVSDPSRLVSEVMQANNEEDTEKVEGLLCGAVKNLRAHRAKPDQVLYLALLCVAKVTPYVFLTSERVLAAFCSLLKRDVKESYKSKGNTLVPVLAANILMAAFAKERNWPDSLVRVYIEDSMGERVWVDHPDCRGFVNNIATAFGTKISPLVASFGKPLSGEGSGRECASPPVGSGSGSGSGSATPTRPNLGEEELQADVGGFPINEEGSKDDQDVSVAPRFLASQASVEHIVLEMVRDQLNRRQGTDNITRSFLKFLISAAGLVEVRHMVIPKLEMWIMNPKVSRVAQDLLLTVAMNCTTGGAAGPDAEVLVAFSKLRFKNKPNINLYLQCVREICLSHPDNLPALLKLTIFNELSNARNPNNMAVLNAIFSCDPERGASGLASVFLDLLLQKDDYLRALRMLLREVVRALRHDINLHIFCQHLIKEMGAKEVIIKDFEFKERLIFSIADLMTLSMFVSISPAVREAITAYHRSEKKDVSPYKAYLRTLALIQRDALRWFVEVIPRVFKGLNYAKWLHKVLFTANQEEYFNLDGWPVEGDRMFYFKATSEIPLLQDTVTYIFLIGLNKNLPLNGRDTIDLVECLVKRAGSLHLGATIDEFPVLECDKAEEMFQQLFQLSTYTFPDSINLPQNYTPPSMAISTSYWRAWTILAFYVSHNPVEFGTLAWDSLPTLKAFMEMCITNQFVFPPPTMASGEQADHMKSKELQISAVEKQAILTFEKHLAAATSKDTITESNSLLLAQLISRDPAGPLRRPPQQVLDTLRNYNNTYKLGHLLCRSRSPDFLLDILQRQGTNQAMPWLADLVESNEGSFSVLPVQCLCEFLLNSSLGKEGASSDEEILPSKQLEAKKRKQKQLLQHLQTLLQHPDTDPRSCCETLDYFLRRLASQQSQQRSQALRGLRLLLTPIQAEDDEVQIMQVEGEANDSHWLLHHLPQLPCFPEFYPHISAALRAACQVENDPNVISWYIRFLAHYVPETLSDVADLCLDMASIIVERSSVLPAILPGPQCKSGSADDSFHSLLNLFVGYMRQLRSNPNVPLREWAREHQDEVITIVWDASNSATLHFFVVHAQVILLTFKPQGRCVSLFNEMLYLWFPSATGTPKAYCLTLPEEEVPLIPDWLKLKMIRSDMPVLVDAALTNLEPPKLVLFIQSFGIPVSAMSKLLKALDAAVETNLEAVRDAVMDKNYMGQLVSVQHRREAVGGHKFAKALGKEYLI